MLADLEPQPQSEVDEEVVLASLRRVLPLAEEKGVTLLVETNGVFADTARLCRLMDEAASDALGVSGIPTILTGLWAKPQSRPCKILVHISNTFT